MNNTFGMIKVGDVHTDKCPVGTKIRFMEEKQSYTVQASNRFYSICTKPLNIHKTVLYTIVDWHNQVRGTENLIFGMGAESKEDCEEMLDRLTNADSDISHRNYIALNIEKVTWTKLDKSYE